MDYTEMDDLVFELGDMRRRAEWIEAALRNALRAIGVDDDAVDEAIETYDSDCLPADGVDTHAVAEGLGVDHDEAWERFCRDYVPDAADNALAAIYRHGRDNTDWPEHMQERAFAAYMQMNADSLPKEGYTHYAE